MQRKQGAGGAVEGHGLEHQDGRVYQQESRTLQLLTETATPVFDSIPLACYAELALRQGMPHQFQRLVEVFRNHVRPACRCPVHVDLAASFTSLKASNGPLLFRT